jgi:hypothetical protein
MALINHVRQQSYGPRPFDGYGHLALMLGAVAGNPARHYFAPLRRDEFFQARSILIINVFNFIDAKFAHFTARAPGTISFAAVHTRHGTASFPYP